MIDRPLKPVIWLRSTRRDFRAMPAVVKSDMGYALFLAQQTFIAVFGVPQAMAQFGEAPSAKPAAISIICRAFQW